MDERDTEEGTPPEAATAEPPNEQRVEATASVQGAHTCSAEEQRAELGALATSGHGSLHGPLTQQSQQDDARAAQAARLTLAAGEHGDTTGITLAGIKHAMAELRRANPEAFEPKVIEGEFVVDNGHGHGGVAYRKSADMNDRDGAAAMNGDRVTAVSQTGEWIKVQDGRWLPKLGLKPAVRHMTTSDLIKAHIQPVTVPPGWTVEPEVTNEENSWYTHHYVDQATGERYTQRPPPGTFSLCAKFAADPATAHFIGKPTHFLSHAHTMSVEETLGSVERYASKLPAEALATMYWWVDGFSIDQHECQYSPPSIDDNSAAWAKTFEDAIRKMGNVVMVLNPWNEPLVLSRLWCLWELNCAVQTGSTFSICLSSEQETAFRTALSSNTGLAMMTLSNIDVNKAEGNAKDKAMIMGGIRASPGGAEALNQTAVEQLREKFIGESARDWVRSLRSADGSLESEEAVDAAWSVATLVGHHLGHHEESRDLWAEVAAGMERLEGADAEGANFFRYENILKAQGMLAASMGEMGQVAEAKVLYEEILSKVAEKFDAGSESEMVLNTQIVNSLAGLLFYEEEYELALEKYDAVIDGRAKMVGADDSEQVAKTLQIRSNRASTYHLLGRYDEAKVEYETVLAGQRALPQLGLRHPLTMRTQENLAVLLCDHLGEQQEALRLMRDVVATQTTVLGADHPHTQNAALSLAMMEREADPEHATPMVCGRVVKLAASTANVPAGTAGEIVEVKEDGYRRVRFPLGTWNYTPDQLLLATREEETQWFVTKAELDKADASHAATLAVGVVVTWSGADDDIPAGTLGEVVEITDDGRRRVRFPAGTWGFVPSQLAVATDDGVNQ